MSRDWTEQIYGDMESINIDDVIKEKEKQIKRLQEQLAEANEVIKTTKTLSGRVDLSRLPYLDRRRVDGITMETVEYMDKWGVR